MLLSVFFFCVLLCSSVAFCGLLWPALPARVSCSTVINVRLAPLIIVVVAAAAGAFLLPPIPQDPAYHAFADRRTIAGIPNALDVLSNIPFLIVGCFGLAVLRVHGAQMEPWQTRTYAALFIGTALTGFGSAYYHLAPDDARLVWDRLPMTIGFMGLLTAMIGERVSVRAARRLFVPLLALGALSVAYWAWTEGRGAGDLRLYGLVQFGSLAAVLLLLALYRATQPGTVYLLAGLGAYAAAKVFEALDAQIYALGQIVSGHTLKHVAAAVGLAFIAAMLRHRTRDCVLGCVP
jgi:hypothetical protein